jgi:hypothetical protein
MMKMPNPKPETRCTNAAPIHINTRNIVVSCIFLNKTVLFVKIFMQRYVFLDKNLFFSKENYYFCSRNSQ